MVKIEKRQPCYIGVELLKVGDCFEIGSYPDTFFMRVPMGQVDCSQMDTKNSYPCVDFSTGTIKWFEKGGSVRKVGLEIRETSEVT